MAYATEEDMRRACGDEFVTDVTPTDATGPSLTIDQALDDASAELDAYLSARYELPLSSTPRVLRRPCIDVAAYMLANAHTRLTNTIEDRYEAAIKLMRLIGEGKAGLGRDEPSSKVEGSTTGTASGADFSAQPRRFGRGR